MKKPPEMQEPKTESSTEPSIHADEIFKDNAHYVHNQNQNKHFVFCSLNSKTRRYEKTT
jgi:hypothetical protein